jgi:hypothetical protein
MQAALDTKTADIQQKLTPHRIRPAKKSLQLAGFITPEADAFKIFCGRDASFVAGAELFVDGGAAQV